MVDANQRWGVQEAIDWMIPLAKHNLTWIEEPTSPDDILGHAKISEVNIVRCVSCRFPRLSENLAGVEMN